MEKFPRADGEGGHRAAGSETAHRPVRSELDATRQSALRDRTVFRSSRFASSLRENRKRAGRLRAGVQADRDFIDRVAGGAAQLENQSATDEWKLPVSRRQ